MKRILVPCDFSECSQEAFRFAIQLTADKNDELHVLFVIDLTFLGGAPTLSHAYAFNAQFLRQIEREAEEKFQQMWEKFAPPMLGVKFRHRTGVFALEVEQYVKENNINLIVMGTTGTGGSKWGSNAEKIVRNSPIPVIAIRKVPSTPVQNIVVPVSLLQDDAVFVQRLRELQRLFNAKLHLLYVNTPQFFTKDRSMHKQMQAFIEKHDLTDCATHFRSDFSIQEGIAHFVREKPYDMIAMGTHGWKGLWHFMLGSITEDIVNELQVPVWTYHLGMKAKEGTSAAAASTVESHL